MANRIPVKATFTSSTVTGLAEFQSGDTIDISTYLSANSITFAGDSGSDSAVLGETLTIAGGTNITTAVTSNTVTINLDSNVVTETSTDTLTNKSIDLANNTITGTTAEFNTALSDGSFTTLAGTETLTNKTISGSSNTLSNIGNSSLTNSSITFAGDSGSDGASLGETLTISGTSNEIETAVTSNTVTIGLPDSVSITSNLTVGGNLTVNGTTTTVNSTTIEITNSFTFEGSTADAYETVLGVVDPTADRTISLPDATGTIVLKDTTDTLTNKTINLSSNTLTGTTAQFNTALSDGSFATLAGTETLTNKTLTSPIISTISNTGTLTLPTSTGTVALTSDIPTNNNQLTNGASYITASSTDTLTNKSGNISQWTNDSGYLTSFTETNDLSAAVTWANVPNANITQSSVTQHQAALSITESQISDLGSYITASSTDTLTNKTIASPTITGSLTVSSSGITFSDGSTQTSAGASAAFAIAQAVALG